ncbi:amino acid--tRNA ligase-related protein [Shigella flexneri]
MANAYDMVINGYEVGGGSVRIDNGDMQQTVFGILGINEEDSARNSAPADALKYGTPPTQVWHSARPSDHAADRHRNIRDVIAFPKTTAAACAMTEAPSFANPTALAEASIGV